MVLKKRRCMKIFCLPLLMCVMIDFFVLTIGFLSIFVAIKRIGDVDPIWV